MNIIDTIISWSPWLKTSFFHDSLLFFSLDYERNSFFYTHIYLCIHNPTHFKLSLTSPEIFSWTLCCCKYDLQTSSFSITEAGSKCTISSLTLNLQSRICVLTRLPPTHTPQLGFPGGSDDKESVCNARDTGSVLGSGRSRGEGNDYPIYFSCLENCMDRGAWQASVLEVTKSQTRLSD